ncbi:adenylate and guanylate cyclase catalytic domain-containing protein [Fimicolochytrium jonesii]|uniref:adenylate and guanylate cyclase catalytic domain-containing protein n=1 Tax=Fimicolochytrium jonesii TaxID=1396493 RepID=UPI0022FDC619|nr:adenylate and guanylate cyclase catalytic domain-containing protein [Fimicolochytrium jonesii]KAI8827139.1 adenylate and guanylate cyclase catalytic domain-containing protein [Fimicolochytrium jonesii]
MSAAVRRPSTTSSPHTGDASNSLQLSKIDGSNNQLARTGRDDELEKTLKLMAIEDQALVFALDQEREQMESSRERIHRMNNFRIDEAHIREANIAESQFLVDGQNNERKSLAAAEVEAAAVLKEEESEKRMLEMLTRELRSLKMSVSQNNEAAEKILGVKKKIAERRVSNSMKLVGIEVRQERERKALQETHTRIMKNMSLFRNILLQEIEDADLHKMVTESGEADGEGNQAVLDKQDADKVHQAKLLQLKLRMQKEVEQLREEHLMRLKHIMKLCELELAQTEETETLIAEQKIQELELEVEQKKEMESEEDQIAQQRASLKAFQTQRHLQVKATRTLAQQRYEARQLARQQKLAAKNRERQFIAQEEQLSESLKAMDDDEDNEEGSQPGTNPESGDAGARKMVALQSARRGGPASEISAGESAYADSEISDMPSEAHTELLDDEGEAITSTEAENMEAEDNMRKERSRIEQLVQRQKQALETARTQHREMREALKRENQQQKNALHAEQEEEYKQLKVQHHKETEALLNTQSAANALEDDNKGANELLYGMLPRYVADAMKIGAEVPPKDFDCVTIMFVDIVQFTNLTSRSSPDQIVNLLNRLYTAFDAALDNYTDLYKTETIGDAYQIVSGLNIDAEAHTPEERAAVTKRNAVDMVDCAVRFIEDVRNLDMSDQVQRELHIRIGVHSGPCIGGVAGVKMPKFAIFGDSASVAGQMEQKSAPNKIHISQATYEFIADGPYITQKNGEGIKLEGGQELQTYWVSGKKHGQQESAHRHSSVPKKKAHRVTMK